MNATPIRQIQRDAAEWLSDALISTAQEANADTRGGTSYFFAVLNRSTMSFHEETIFALVLSAV